MTRPNLRLKGMVAIVTGASSGIGEATAREFARRGVNVVLAARREERLDRIAKEIAFEAGPEGGMPLVVSTDLTQRYQITHLVETTMDVFGRIDILANIAGWGRYDWFEELTPGDLREQYEVNVLGLAELTRQVIPVMKAQRSGHIINMSSYASKVAVPPLTVYASTKYAVEGLTDGLRRELKPWGINVSRVHPSGVKGTEFNIRAAQHGGIRYRSLPIGKVTKEHVARVVVGLVENPRRAVFLSHLYDAPVALNLLAPGLIDQFFLYWVRWKRRWDFQKAQSQETPAPQPAQYHDPHIVLPLAMLAFAGVWAFRARKKQSP